MNQPYAPATAYPSVGRVSLPGFGLVVGLHLAVLAVLFALDVVPLPLPATLSVRIVEPEVLPPEPVAPRTAPPKPEPVLRRAPAPQARSKAAAETPLLAAAVPAVAQEPLQAHAMDEPPTPETPAPAPPAAVAVPVPVSEPRFDAAYLDNPAPAYPALSRRMGEEGKVILRVFVEPSGQPSQVMVSASSGHSRLDDAALAAVRRWKFIPAQRGGEALAAWVLVPIAFNLKN